MSIDEVRQCGKVVEVAICFTGDFLKEDEKIYTLDYYRRRAEEVCESGAHMCGIKVYDLVIVRNKAQIFS